MKLFLQLVPGIIFKQILFFFSFKLSVTFAHLPLKKKKKQNPRSFYERYPDIYIYIIPSSSLSSL